LVLQLSTAARVRVAASVVLVTMLWPFGHYFLSVRYDVNPWKLWGMAMYCTTHETTLHFTYRGDDGEIRPLALDSLGPELRARALQHYRRRATLGRLYPLDGLAREILAARPDVDELIMKSGVKRLDAASGRFARSERMHRYARENRMVELESTVQSNDRRRWSD